VTIAEAAARERLGSRFLECGGSTPLWVSSDALQAVQKPPHSKGGGADSLECGSPSPLWILQKQPKAVSNHRTPKTPSQKTVMHPCSPAWAGGTRGGLAATLSSVPTRDP